MYIYIFLFTKKPKNFYSQLFWAFFIHLEMIPIRFNKIDSLLPPLVQPMQLDPRYINWYDQHYPTTTPQVINGKLLQVAQKRPAPMKAPRERMAMIINDLLEEELSDTSSECNESCCEDHYVLDYPSDDEGEPIRPFTNHMALYLVDKKGDCLASQIFENYDVPFDYNDFTE